MERPQFLSGISSRTHTISNDSNRGDWVQLQQGTIATKIKKGVKYYLVVLKKSVRNLAEMGCELQLQSMFLCFLTFLKMRRPP